ncbi:nuclear transport factor 2 family protein [Pectobacterium polonicum]|uniref:Nuclear transport factor 2 family protein n=1 Tax=Pectobacterium polonicum TaxID=2485124 RepID=A0AAE9T1D3_9GAMM|nr:nuclear transport factor 2 family protein [Pectobacterium polonicum]TKY81718.1 steroid delta-isomerase [Pectobacterium polonicum]UVO10385.1 nuclear transport factor 2 family protein [Pectobacterium polonicum]GKW22511.1 steroid Delta-isomerase [Pectobacterium carotovorum subsp. carotovorum]
MSPELVVAAQFKAYNEHDIDAFMVCFSPDFKAYRMPSETPSMEGKEALREFYVNNRFNNPELRAELVSRTVLGNKVFDHELIHGLSVEPIESIAAFEIEQDLIKTAWFFFS